MNAVLLLPLLAVLAAGPAPNRWTPLNDGTYAPAKGNWPNLTGPAFLWISDLDRGLVAPILTETEGRTEPGYRTMSFEKPQWEFVPGRTPTTPDIFDSPRGYVYLPGLKRVLFVKQQWWWSSKKDPISGWLLDPVAAAWEPLEGPLSMSDRFEEFNPASVTDLPVSLSEAANKSAMRLPVWGSVCYDPQNQEAVSFGGGGVWGRVGKTKEAVKPGDWIFDESAQRVRRLTPDDAGKTASARRWFPAHCGTWVFAEADKTWKAIEQPLGQQPSARILPGMAYDAGEKKIVLFGGDDLTKCFGDTWVYDCATRAWRQVKTSVAPQARAGHALVYVPDQKVVLLIGGYAAGWQPLQDVWAFNTAKAEWARLDLDLPAAAGHASADYDPKRKLVVLVAYPATRGNSKMPVYALKLDLSSVARATPRPTGDPRLDFHCKAKDWGKLPDEWLAGDLAADDAKAGLRAVAAQPANTWVLRQPPYAPPGRDWGSNVYDPRTHRGYAWGGGHSTYPGADVIEYDVGLDRWVGMADAPNYNPVWLHGMVAGPPGVSAGGWSLLPSHSRKSYGIDIASNSLITYVGDVYDLKHRMFVTSIGLCPGKYDVSTQVLFCTAPHGLYAYSTGLLVKANVAAGKWEKVASGGPQHNEHGHVCHDSKRDRLIYFERDTKKVWTFDFASKQWSQEQVQGDSPAKACGDSTYIPELDAALLICAEDKNAPERMYFYKLKEHRWYCADCIGDTFQYPNIEGRDFSPVYDPALKAVVRIKNLHRMEVMVLRLDPSSLKLSKLDTGEFRSEDH